jgi:predicted AlkP superfamily phosphohydrolase/phosphomutase
VSRSPPLLLVAFDACDPDMALALAAAGRMPALAALLARGATAPIVNPPGLFVGALWMSFATGLRPDRHGFHCWDEIDRASYQRRLTDPVRARGTPFWRLPASRPLRLAVIDVPHSRADRPMPGLQLVEWGCHDRHFGLHAWPAGAAAAIERRFGLHPILGLDPYTVREFAPDDYACRAGPLRTAAEESALLAGLLAGVEAKRRLTAGLLAEGPWDLFLAVFGESHAVGHQLWHVRDPGHPRHDPAVAVALGDPLARIYERLDAALAELVDAVGDETTILLLLSHGMGPHHDGTHLLDALLRRLDQAAEERLPGGALRRLADRATRRLPPVLRRRVAAALLPALRRRIARWPPAAVAEFVDPAERAEQRFFMTPNNFVVGGVRLNLAGREPCGRVAPAETETVAARLAADLRALVNVDDGGPVVHALEPSARWYRRDAADTLPDYFLTWERGRPIERVWSPQVGLVAAPYANWRTGDHRPDGLLVAAGPGLAGAPAGMAVEDLTASLAARLGLPTGGMDGRPQPWLAGPSP